MRSLPLYLPGISEAVEPDTDAETSIGASLGVSAVDDFKCESCGGVEARQQTRLSDLPQFLVVHINKYADSNGSMAEANVRVSGTEM